MLVSGTSIHHWDICFMSANIEGKRERRDRYERQETDVKGGGRGGKGEGGGGKGEGGRCGGREGGRRRGREGGGRRDRNEGKLYANTQLYLYSRIL